MTDSKKPLGVIKKIMAWQNCGWEATSYRFCSNYKEELGRNRSFFYPQPGWSLDEAAVSLDLAQWSPVSQKDWALWVYLRLLTLFYSLIFECVSVFLGKCSLDLVRWSSRDKSLGLMGEFICLGQEEKWYSQGKMVFIYKKNNLSSIEDKDKGNKG